MKKETVYTSIQIDESYWGTLTSKVGGLFSGAKAGNKTGQQTTAAKTPEVKSSADAAPVTPSAPTTSANPETVSIKKVAAYEDLQSMFVDQARTNVLSGIKQIIGKKIVDTPPPPQDELPVDTLRKILSNAGVKDEHAKTFINAVKNKKLVAEWIKLIDNKRLLNESTVNRWKVLAEIKK